MRIVHRNNSFSRNVCKAAGNPASAAVRDMSPTQETSAVRSNFVDRERPACGSHRRGLRLHAREAGCKPVASPMSRRPAAFSGVTRDLARDPAVPAGMAAPVSRGRTVAHRPCPLSGRHPGPDPGSSGNPGRCDGSLRLRQAWSPAPPAPLMGRGVRCSLPDFLAPARETNGSRGELRLPGVTTRGRG